jgi:hypothetical protein
MNWCWRYSFQHVAFLIESGATAHLVNPTRVRRHAEGIGIFSKSDVIDTGLLTHYGIKLKS